jgi:hypothetical protein
MGHHARVAAATATVLVAPHGGRGVQKAHTVRYLEAEDDLPGDTAMGRLRWPAFQGSDSLAPRASQDGGFTGATRKAGSSQAPPPSTPASACSRFFGPLDLISTIYQLWYSFFF